jgi:putative two-component system response regulator
MDKIWSILVVDDEPANLQLMRAILADFYRTIFAKNGEQAIEAARRHQPDLILLDIMMPGLDGFEVCRRLKSDPALVAIPVIFVTAMGELDDEARGFEIGAIDYIVKPASPAIVRARVRTHISLVDQNAVLDRLGLAGEYKDNETGAHVRRIGRYSEVMARRLGWSQAACQAIGRASPMHDIGKIAIPDRVLLKPGKLDEEEWSIMRTHAERGAAIIGGNVTGLMQMAARIASSHHEKWDGTGYPGGFAGDSIPIEGRIVAVADVYDALMSRRPYKEPWPQAKVVDYIVEQSDRHFDPEMVTLVLSAMDEFGSIRAELPD